MNNTRVTQVLNSGWIVNYVNQLGIGNINQLIIVRITPKSKRKQDINYIISVCFEWGPPEQYTVIAISNVNIRSHNVVSVGFGCRCARFRTTGRTGEQTVTHPMHSTWSERRRAWKDTIRSDGRIWEKKNRI
jgi:hypothetical protein